jgi:hypothetical protein
MTGGLGRRPRTDSASPYSRYCWRVAQFLVSPRPTCAEEQVSSQNPVRGGGRVVPAAGAATQRASMCAHPVHNCKPAVCT